MVSFPDEFSKPTALKLSERSASRFRVLDHTTRAKMFHARAAEKSVEMPSAPSSAVRHVPAVPLPPFSRVTARLQSAATTPGSTGSTRERFEGSRFSPVQKENNKKKATGENTGGGQQKRQSCPKGEGGGCLLIAQGL